MAMSNPWKKLWQLWITNHNMQMRLGFTWNNMAVYASVICCLLFRCSFASLYFALSVNRSVGRSVGVVNQISLFLSLSIRTEWGLKEMTVELRSLSLSTVVIFINGRYFYQWSLSVTTIAICDNSLQHIPHRGGRSCITRWTIIIASWDIAKVT